MNTIAEKNTYPENTSVVGEAAPKQQHRSTRSQLPSAKLPNQIKVVDTPGDRFCNEIVADALKIASKGQRVLVVELLKGGIDQGTHRTIDLAENLHWMRCNLTRNISQPDLNDLELDNVRELWKYVKTVAQSDRDSATATGEYSLIILDGLSQAIDLGLITIESATKFLTTLPTRMEIVLTGTNPHPSLLEFA